MNTFIFSDSSYVNLDNVYTVNVNIDEYDKNIAIESFKGGFALIKGVDETFVKYLKENFLFVKTADCGDFFVNPKFVLYENDKIFVTISRAFNKKEA